MSKLVIPLILVFIVVVAGVFAFVPIQNASTVHTTIMANTVRIDEIVLATVTEDDDLRITCPTASDGCRILEIYWEDTDGGAGDNVDLGAVTATINGVAAIVQADIDVQIDDLMEAVAGVSGVTFGGGDVLRIATDNAGSDSSTYNVVIFIEVEGNTVATAAFAP